MAPEISFTSNGDGPNGTPAVDDLSTPYEIDQEAVFNSHQRKIKVLTMGAGVSGVMIAYKVQKECKNVEHVIYEKNADVGGTWFENRYSDCACDIPCRAYINNFAPNPDWSSVYSSSAELQKYLDRVCNVFGLKKYMNFNTRVTGAYWDAEKGEWRVTLSQAMPDGTKREFEDRCHVLLNATGILNNYKWPDLEGIDKFRGRIIHTAAWPEDYQSEQWKNDRVAVIGSGASSIQTVPGMQPYAKHLDIFVRTGTWFVLVAGFAGTNVQYTEEEKEKVRKSPDELVKSCKFVDSRMNGMWEMFYKDSEIQNQTREFLKIRMQEKIKVERLLKGFTPEFGVGCRRVTPGNPYMKAIQEPNVDVHFTAVARFTDNGVMGQDGIERVADTVICATGFDTSYRPHFPIVGENGIDLREKWSVCPDSYLGLAVAGYPNYVSFFGPTWPVEHGSGMGAVGEVGNYALKMIKKIQNEHVHSIVPRQDVTDAFNEHVQEWAKHTVWADKCRRWYKNYETGRVTGIWPGSALHYIELIKQPRFEDYTNTYRNKKNMWSFMGLGKVPAHTDPDADRSPYLSVEAIDPLWLEEI